MKRRFLCGALSLLTLLYPVAVLAEKTAVVPHLVLSTSSWNFGTVESGQKVERVFLIENAGTAELIIESVSTTCKCAEVTLSTKSIPSGEKGEIKFALSTGDFAGEFKGFIMVASNDPDEPVQRIKIVGQVTAPPAET